MQRFNFIDFMVIELRFFNNKNKNKNKMEIWQNVKSTFSAFYIITQPILVYLLFFTHSSPSYREINFKLKLKKEYPYTIYGFQWG